MRVTNNPEWWIFPSHYPDLSPWTKLTYGAPSGSAPDAVFLWRGSRIRLRGVAGLRPALPIFRPSGALPTLSMSLC